MSEPMVIFMASGKRGYLKVHFVIHSLIPHFSAKVEIFIPVEAFSYIMFVLKIFLANFTYLAK